jgi:hypothetical protein
MHPRLSCGYLENIKYNQAHSMISKVIGGIARFVSKGYAFAFFSLFFFSLYYPLYPLLTFLAMVR